MAASSLPLLAHPSVVRSIRARLFTGGIRRSDLEGCVAEVQTRALEALKTHAPPTEVPQWAAFCAKIATEYAIDELRKSDVRAPLDAGLCEDPDAHVAEAIGEGRRDPLETKRLVELLKHHVSEGNMPEDTLEILEGTAAGMSALEIAEELGVSEKTVTQRLARARARFRKILRRLGLSGVALGLLVALLLVHGRREPSPQEGDARLATTASGSSASSVPLVVPPTPVDRARLLRRDAERACGEDRWDDCARLLADAWSLDPAGDDSDVVRALRGRAERGIEQHDRGALGKGAPR